MACHGHLGEVHSINDFLTQHGVRVLIVTFTPFKLVKLFLAENPLAFPIVSDPARDGYRYFKLGRASFLSFFKPQVLVRYFQRFVHGVKIRKPVDQDMQQLGGDFLFAANGELAWSWPSQDATDRPTSADIRAAVESL